MYRPFAIFAYNSSVHFTSGFTPYILTFREQVRISFDLIVSSFTIINGMLSGRLVCNILGAFADAR